MKGIAFLPWYPMAGGKQLRADHPLASMMAQVAARHSATAAQLSLAWLLHKSRVMLPIPGTSKVEHLEENVAAAGLSLSPEEMTELEVVGGF
jgi:aryl-alcohol dehydrogenase-like predicted oxidoreductase